MKKSTNTITKKSAVGKAGEVGVIITKAEDLQGKVYTVRGRKVMLDYDLAAIYGYTTGAFNRQVLRNAGKFEEDFRFQLSHEEYEFLKCQNGITKTVEIGTGENLKCQNGISSSTAAEVGQNLKSQNVASSPGHGGDRHLPYAFTEQGIYMLMTVLRGPLAVEQSKALIRIFKGMKDYIIENQGLIGYRENLQLAAEVVKNTNDIAEAKLGLIKIDREMATVNKEIRSMAAKLDNAVMKSELSPVILDFNNRPEREGFLFLNGELAKADEAYIEIYAQAKKRIYIIDDYINIKTLRHLQKVRKGVEVTIFSDNVRRQLRASDFMDFQQEFPEIKVEFIKTNGEFHDRFVILDPELKNERVFHCGASSKDAGRRLTMIEELTPGKMTEMLGEVVGEMAKNAKLKLD